jgi:hypothetical protein
LDWLEGWRGLRVRVCARACARCMRVREDEVPIDDTMLLARGNGINQLWGQHRHWIGGDDGNGPAREAWRLCLACARKHTVHDTEVSYGNAFDELTMFTWTGECPSQLRSQHLIVLRHCPVRHVRCGGRAGVLPPGIAIWSTDPMPCIAANQWSHTYSIHFLQQAVVHRP